MSNLIKVYPKSKVLVDVRTSFKWMWHPEAQIIIVCLNSQNHAMALKNQTELSEYEFDSWVRFVHLRKDDYDKIDENIICVRPYNKKELTHDNIKSFLNSLYIPTGKIEFNITNERLQELTKNYNEKF